MDCPSPTTIVFDTDADADEATLSAAPSPVASTAMMNLRMLPPPVQEAPREQEERVPHQAPQPAVGPTDRIAPRRNRTIKAGPQKGNAWHCVGGLVARTLAV